MCPKRRIWKGTIDTSDGLRKRKSEKVCHESTVRNGCPWHLLWTLLLIGIIPYTDSRPCGTRHGQGNDENCCSYGSNSIECKNCSLQEFPSLTCLANVSSVPEVEDLHLTSNSIKYVPESYFKMFGNLTEIHLDDNKLIFLQKDSFYGAYNLDTLHLFSNRLFAIQKGAFDGLNALTELSLQNNFLEYLPDGIFSNLTMLIKLELQSNRLHDRSLPRNLLSNLTGLQVINLSANKLTVIPRDFFKGLNSLERVVLKNNLFTAINMHQWPPSCQIIHLQHNPLINIIGVSDRVRKLQATYISMQCTCENKRALELIMGGVKDGLASHCPDLNQADCTAGLLHPENMSFSGSSSPPISSNNSSFSHLKLGNHLQELGTTASSSGLLTITCWSFTLHISAAILMCIINLCQT